MQDRNFFHCIIIILQFFIIVTITPFRARLNATRSQGMALTGIGLLLQLHDMFAKNKELSDFVATQLSALLTCVVEKSAWFLEPHRSICFLPRRIPHHKRGP